MSPWHLCWIIPASAGAGGFLLALYACCVAAGRDDEKNGRK